MIKINELKALRGPSRYSKYPTIFMVLDIGDFEQRPSDKIDGFTDRLVKLIPSLKTHKCSIGEEGGFIQRLNDGTWAGHIIEHIALELQCLAGMDVGYGKTFTKSQTGIYIVVFRYRVEPVGLMAAKEAVSIFEAIAEGRDFDMQKSISGLKVIREHNRFGPSTWSIIQEAKSRDIPFIRLNKSSYVQLGYGVHQKRIQATMTDLTSAIAVEIADEKTRTKDHLKKSGIPVPNGQLVTTIEDAIAVYDEIGVPVVVKPDVGNHGRGATINVTNIEQLKNAFKIAQAIHSEVIIEEYVKGFDYRILVIAGKFVAASRREPAHVLGDGKSSIVKLINEVNKDPRRGFGHEKMLTQIDIDEMTKSIFSLKGISEKYCPEINEKIYLKSTANISQGGTASDVTEEVSPAIRLMAERASQIIGLDCMGIDILAKDLSLPIMESGLKVVEINAAPGFRMHLEPTFGQSRNVAKPLIDMLFPNGYTKVPVVTVTGTNGKTTTCKLIAHALKYSGKNVGLASTTGIEIDGNSILDGDYSGPEGAGIIMKERTVDHIVLEAARGGIVRRGLGVNEVDVGLLLNIGHDHIGKDWIENQEELSLVKSTVIEVVKEAGTSVLNADDKVVMSLVDRAGGTVVLFSLDRANQSIIEHVKSGGMVVTIEDRTVIIRNSTLDRAVCTLEEIPITFGGVVDFNTSNALAGIGALFGLGLSIEQIKNGVRTFYPSINQNPGRMNLLDFLKYKVLLDYGHNPASARALAKLLPRITQGRKIGLCHGSGNRTDEQIINYGKALGTAYDIVIVSEFDPRDRKLGETTKLVQEGLVIGGCDPKNIEIILDPKEAIDYIFSMAETGDLLVIQLDELKDTIGEIMEKFRHAREESQL